jgi:hypothetical protein
VGDDRDERQQLAQALVRWRQLAAEMMEIFPTDADAYRGALAAAPKPSVSWH